MNPHRTSNKSWVVRMPVDKETHLIGIIETNAWLLAWHLYVTFLKGINYSIRLIFSYSKTSCFTSTEGISMTHNSYLQDSKTTCFTVRDDGDENEEAPGHCCSRAPVEEKVAASYSPALHCSTIGASGLNFSVRNGKRWDPAAITTW